MKKLLLIILCQIIIMNYGVTISNAQCTGVEIWRDDFNGSSLDLTKWAYELGDGCPGLCGWGNGELEYYSNLPSNVQVTGGNLVITATPNANYLGSGKNFTSGKLLTRDVPNPPNINNWTYGRFEAYMRLPKGAGLWPAFWMLPYNSAIPWPTSGEIDIMEYRGDNPNQVNGTLHYGQLWPNNKYDGNSYINGAIDFSAAFHLYAVEWSPTSIRMYVDNVLYKVETNYLTPNTLTPTSNSTTWPWTIPYYMIINLAVGGSYTGVLADAGVVLTKPTLEVDYVRIVDITTQVPFIGVATIPGKVEVENYDLGCDIPTYYDATPFNDGTVCCGYTYRTEEGVDLEPTGDVGGGSDIGWTVAGEWLTYSVNVTTSATYNFIFRTAAPAAGGAVHVEIDGVNVTGTVNIPSTGSWTTWGNTTKVTTGITAGAHILKLVIETAGFNINYINTTVNTPMPVGLLYFNASNLKENVLLQWSTAFEKDNKEFQLERSLDGINFETIHIEYGTGNSSQNKNYSYLDKKIGRGENAYYRLKQVDLNGATTYSSIITIESEALDIKIYPNPSQDVLHIDFNKIPEEIIVTDILGNVIAKLSSAQLTLATTLQTIEWKKGIYFIEVINTGETKNYKVVKN